MTVLTLDRILIPAILYVVLVFPAVYAEGNSSRQDQTSSTEHHVRPIDEAGLKRLLTVQKGHVVVLNFWATWCEPCREEFPELIRFHEDYRRRGVVLIFLSLDEPDQSETVEHFLEEHKINFTSYLRSEEDLDPLVNLIDPDWPGALPSTFLFDRDGKRVETFLGSRDYETFVKFVEPLM